jgi:hypothetical protein
MIAELHLYGGVVLTSEAYGPLAHTLTSYLDELGQAEFHGTEIINPKSKSSWKKLNYGQRLAALSKLLTIVADSQPTFIHVRISKSQYLEIVESTFGISPGDTHKTAVKEVFLQLAAPYLMGKGPAVLLVDRDKNNPGPGLIKFPGSTSLTAGGAISVHSTEIMGLQIADVVAYGIGRYLRRRDGIISGGSAIEDPFDEVITDFVGKLDGRLYNLLSPSPQSSVDESPDCS